MKDASIKRRERYEAFISRVELLQDLDSYEKNNFCDVLESEIFEKGQEVIKEGEKGTKFYFIEEGEAEAVKKTGGKEEIVYRYKANDYFGELALLRDEPRAATVRAVSATLRLCSIDREVFKRLLGPLEDLLKRNTARYEKFVKSKHN